MPGKTSLLVAAAAVLACLVCMVPGAAVAGILALALGAGAGAALAGSGAVGVACLALAAAAAAFAVVRRRLARRRAAAPLA
jgi:hypothetical protein